VLKYNTTTKEMEQVVKYLVEKPRHGRRNNLFISVVTFVLLIYCVISLYLKSATLTVPGQDWKVPNALVRYSETSHSLVIDPDVAVSTDGELSCSNSLKVGEVEYTDENVAKGSVYFCDALGKAGFSDAMVLDENNQKLYVKRLISDEPAVYENLSTVQSKKKPLIFEGSADRRKLLKIVDGDKLRLEGSLDSLIRCEAIDRDFLPVFKYFHDPTLISSNLSIDSTRFPSWRPHSLLYIDENHQIVPLETPPTPSEEVFYVLAANRDQLFWHAFPKFYQMNLGPALHVLVRQVDGSYTWQPRTFAHSGNVMFPEPDKNRDGSLVAFEGNYKTLKNVPITLISRAVHFHEFSYVARLLDGTTTLAPRLLPPKDGSLGLLTHDGEKFSLSIHKTTNAQLFSAPHNSSLMLDYDGQLKGHYDVLRADLDLGNRKLTNLSMAWNWKQDDTQAARVTDLKRKCLFRYATGGYKAMHFCVKVDVDPTQPQDPLNWGTFVHGVGMHLDSGNKSYSSSDLPIRNVKDDTSMVSLVTKKFVHSLAVASTVTLVLDDKVHAKHPKTFCHGNEQEYEFGHTNNYKLIRVFVRQHFLGRSTPIIPFSVTVQNGMGKTKKLDVHNPQIGVSADLNWNVVAGNKFSAVLNEDFVPRNLYFIYFVFCTK